MRADAPPMTVPAARIVFSEEDRAEVLALVDESLRTGSLTLGPRTRELENAFAARHQMPFAVAVNSGTSALEIVLRALGAGGREVVVPTNTFFATAAAVVHAGGVPRFADVAADTFALTAASAEAAIRPETAGVIVVHVGGVVSPEVEAVAELCRDRGLFLVEDAAHAHGAALHGRPAGTFGDAAAFSFYPTKVVTSGEGGMVVTADERLRDEALLYRDQGKASFLAGDHVRLGSAWRMSELHAAVGLVQLRRLDEFVATRRRTATLYDEALAAVTGLRPVIPPPGCETNYYKYMALLDDGIERAQVKEQLRLRHGVTLSGEVYAVPLHRQPVFATYDRAAFPVAEDVCRRQVCLPVHSDMTEAEASHVVGALHAVLDEGAGAGA